MVGLRNSQASKGYGTVFMQCRRDLLALLGEGKHFLEKTIRELNSVVKTDYGLVTVMRGNQYPGVYFGDVPASIHLTEEQERNAELWHKEGARFGTLVREVYWGNVLSGSHWRNDRAKEAFLVAELQRECAGNVFRVDEETIFFCAPFDILEWESRTRQMQRFRSRVRRILQNTSIEVLT